MEGATILLKISLGGATNAGKSSFILREIEDKFHHGFYSNTIGVDFFMKEFTIG